MMIKTTKARPVPLTPHVLAVAAAWLLSPLPALAQGASAPPSPAARTATTTAEYRLGAGDVIRISVYQNPDLSLETRVTEAGVISYPLLGQLPLGNKSVTQAEQLIADGLRSGNYLRQPQVTVTVLQVRGNQVSVLGHVRTPGRLPIDSAELRLIDALAMAGGIDVTGADLVTVVGVRDGQPYRKEIDLPTLFTPSGRDLDVAVKNGDTVWVDRAPTVFIYGEVQRPGALRLERSLTVMQALASGGGLTERGTEKGLRIHRRAADGKVQVVQPAMDDLLQPGDVVYVRESLF